MSKEPPNLVGGSLSPVLNRWLHHSGLWRPDAYLLKPSRKDSPMRRAASAMVSIIPRAPSE